MDDQTSEVAQYNPHWNGVSLNSLSSVIILISVLDGESDATTCTETEVKLHR